MTPMSASPPKTEVVWQNGYDPPNPKLGSFCHTTDLRSRSKHLRARFCFAQAALS
jgi:hypothetical protein